MTMGRRVLLGGAGLAAAGLGYAAWVEPAMRLAIVRHRPVLAGWQGRAPLRIVVLSDFHAGEPVMPAARVAAIVAEANALRPDLILLPGDHAGHARFETRPVPLPTIASLLGALRAPLGVYGVLGNHDWWDDPQASRRIAPQTVAALQAVGIGVLRNAAVRLRDGADGFWLAGLDSQTAFGRRENQEIFGGQDSQTALGRRSGAHDMARTLAAITDDAPAILMAHEPDIFVRATPRFDLQISGHTHGGQIRLGGWSPRVPSAFGNRFAYGLIQEGGRNLVVSGGLGCSIAPVRFGVPPEITLVEIA